MAFIPVCWMVFTLRQAHNLLWGWQTQIALCVVAFVAATALLGDGEVSVRRWLGAGACAVVAAFSFAAGLMTLPVLLLQILHHQWLRKRAGTGTWKPGPLLAWLFLTAASWAAYLFHYAKPTHRPESDFVLTHPAIGLYAWVATLGGSASGDVRGAAACGAVILLLGVALLVASARGWVEPSKLGPALPLVALALGTAAMISGGRAGFGLQGTANASRYVTLTLLGTVGLHFGILAVKAPAARGVLAGMMGALVTLMVFGSYDGAYAGGASYRSARQMDVEFFRHLSSHPEGALRAHSVHPELLRERTATLQRYGLGIFAGAGAAPPPDQQL